MCLYSKKNNGRKIVYADSIYELYKIVKYTGPIYAYYRNAKTKKSHLVVVTGVDADRGVVYTNNPWGIKGIQTFEQFQNGFAKNNNYGNSDYKLKGLYLIK